MASSCLPCVTRPENSHDLQNSPKLVALLNPKGGAGKAERAMHLLKNYENCHVLDILRFAGEEQAEAREELKRTVGDCSESRLMLCGGDGTVTWGFSIAETLKLNCPVAILPMGTANEISKCTGWDNSFKIKNLRRFVKSVRSQPLIDFDLWEVKYEDSPEAENLPLRRPGIMGAFLSFGLDAKIALKFHQRRNKKKRQPSVSQSKMSYFKYAVAELFSKTVDLREQIRLTVDGEAVDFPNTVQCLQVLNINSMSGGVDFFGKGKCGKRDVLQENGSTAPKLNDGKVEVVAERNIHHYSSCYANFARAQRIAQGRRIVVETSRPIAMEIDGEPFINPKGKIVIERMCSRKMVLGFVENQSTKKGIY